MRNSLSIAALLTAACTSLASAQTNVAQPIAADIELQSGPLTPALALDESPRPIHQVRILVDSRHDRGTLILDGNAPVFDEFGALVGGLQTPHVRAKGGPLPPVQLDCTIKLVKEVSDKWRLFRLSGPELRTPLAVATRGAIADGGPARLIVLGPDQKPKTVIDCTRYGLVVP